MHKFRKVLILPAGVLFSMSAMAERSLDPARVAVLEPAMSSPGVTFATPLSAVALDPRVDIQGRNFLEAQGDVTIRGGTFENTGFRLGAANLLDPQTGHYSAEIPVPLSMLTAPAILTGSDNARLGFNATAGTIAYGWRPLTSGGEVSAGLGEYGLNTQELRFGYRSESGPFDGWGAELDVARSEANGDVPNSDHEFFRLAGRLQHTGSAGAQTDLFAGYQSKFFGLVNLYAAPFNSPEAENLKTRLFLANHRYDEGDYQIELTAYHRRHSDDYDFNRFNPGLGNPFIHETEVTGGGFSGQNSRGELTLHWNGQIYAETIESTALTFGNFNSRTLWQLSAGPEYRWHPGTDQELTAATYLTYADSNRDEASLLPSARIALSQPGEDRNWTLYLDYAGSSQVPGYTALNSNAQAGLFRGNPDLGREESHAFELGGLYGTGPWESRAATFVRRDKSLTDWTFRRDATTARSANPIDLWVYGVETVLGYRTSAGSYQLGYAFLKKDEDYGEAQVDASYYALNYAEHRLTLAIIQELVSWLELRVDTDWRQQRANLLRTTGDNALITNAAVVITPATSVDASITLGVWNLWDEDYEDIPGVRRLGRLFSASVAYRF